MRTTCLPVPIRTDAGDERTNANGTKDVGRIPVASERGARTKRDTTVIAAKMTITTTTTTTTITWTVTVMEKSRRRTPQRLTVVTTLRKRLPSPTTPRPVATEHPTRVTALPTPDTERLTQDMAHRPPGTARPQLMTVEGGCR